MFSDFKLCRENFFKDCGEVVDVRFSSDEDGRFKGFGHVEFATGEAAQKVSICQSNIIISLCNLLLKFGTESTAYVSNKHMCAYLRHLQCALTE